MAMMSMVAALNAALRTAMNDDPRVLVLGEDVGRLGGVFRVTDGLLADFGDRRVFDTPLAESGIVGVSVGLALAGWRPVPEMQFNAFSYPALDQIFSHVAKYRSRSAGVVSLPVVIRMPAGGGIGAAEHHSESPEVLFAHTAGLKVVTPFRPQDAYQLLVEAIRDPDPVIFLEPTARYWAKDDVDVTRQDAVLGRGRVALEGDHVTLISWGGAVGTCLEAAAVAAGDGVRCEVVDLRSLAPLDLDTLLASVWKTGRVVTVHEAPQTAGFGAEITARVVEDAFDGLHAPPQRVAGDDIPYPPALLEKEYLPSVPRVLDAVATVLNY